MKATEGKVGRIFVIRLEDGDVIPECIEKFASRRKIAVAYAILIGGIGGGQVVSGPRLTEERPPDPLYLPVDGVHEVAGVGILAPDAKGKPVLHIHASLGRAGSTLTGCLRPGVTTWLTGEVILVEVLGADVARLIDKASGFELLEVMEKKGKEKMKEKLNDILACPVCKSKLKLKIDETKGDEIITGSLYCPKCSVTYLIKEGIPHLLPPKKK